MIQAEQVKSSVLQVFYRLTFHSAIPFHVPRFIPTPYRAISHYALLPQGISITMCYLLYRLVIVD